MENNESSLYCEIGQSFQEQYNIEYLSSRQLSLHSMEKFGNSTIEIFPGKTLNINNNMEEFQKKELIRMLQEHSYSYAWENIDMKGIDPNTCKHHIYIEENAKLVQQPQRRMNPTLREIFKDEL